MKDIKDIDLKQIIEQETGQIFNKENKIRSPFNAADKNPSFSIHYDSNAGKQKFKDFSDGLTFSGDAIDFIMKYRNMDYKQARQHLGLSVEKTEIEELKDKVLSYVNWQIENHENKKGYKVVGIFPFVDENNKTLYFKVKFLKPTGKKETPYYHINNDGAVKPGRGEHEEVIYNQYNVIQAVKRNDIIIITEGEKNANRLNMTLRKGYCATSVKNVKNLSDIQFLKGAKIHVCGDSGKAGEEYKQSVYNALYKDSKEFKFIRLPGLEKLGENKDIDDWLDLGHNKADLLEAISRSLDFKNIFELQQDKHGIYKMVKEGKSDEVTYKKKYISNFSVIDFKKFEYVEEQLNDIEISIKNEFGKKIKRFGNASILNDIRSFRNFLNDTDFVFKGDTSDLIRFQEWISKYFKSEECSLYEGNQFKKIDDKLCFITSKGTLSKDGINSKIMTKNFDDRSSIIDVGEITKEELQELKTRLFNFYDYKTTFSILGTVINDLAVYQAIENKIKFPHLFIVGESGSGKSTILEQVIASLLNYPLMDKKSMGNSTKFSMTKCLSIGNYPVIYDEYKPTQLDSKKLKDISEKLRNAYDRSIDERGNKKQEINAYRPTRPIILAGEEGYKDEEKALIERSCIVYISKAERTKENTEAMEWLISNNSLLNKLGKKLIQKVLSISVQEYKELYDVIHEKSKSEYSFLADRPLNTHVCASIGIDLLNRVLIDYGVDIIQNYSGFIAANIHEEVLENGEEQHSMVEKMLIMLNKGIEGTTRVENVEDFILCENNELYIRTALMLEELRKYKNRTYNDSNILSDNDFNKQAKKAKYIIKKRCTKRMNGNPVSADLYDIDKFRNLGLYSILGEEELIPEPIGLEESKVINMFNK